MQFITKYRVFQFVGWSLFAFLNIYIAIITREISAPIFYMNVLLAILGFGCTHFYRFLIHVQHWKQMKTERLLLHIVTSTLFLTIAFIGCYFILLKIFQFQNWLPHTHQISLSTFIAVFMLFMTWNALYFAWHYVEHNRSLLIGQLKLESQMKDLEIKTIKANLQPHFIFNSLNSIRALIDENPMLAREAITKISRILRQSISQQEATDSLENEMRLVEDYLDLEKIRFEERLQFKTEIEEDTLAVQIPTMMLQTIVENAVKHGISRIEAGGVISIQSKFVGDEFILEISNSGNLNNLQDAETSLGFGLNATRQRLKLLYQHNANFDIKESNNQVIVTIKIKKPLRS